MQEKIRWWKDDEIDHAYRRVQMATGAWLGGGFVNAPYRKADIIMRCAARAMRRYKLKKDVKTWNMLCEKIGKRMSAHYRSLEVATFSARDARPKAPIYFSNDDYKPLLKRSGYEIRERLDRYVLFIKMRDKYTCSCCNQIDETTDQTWYEKVPDDKLLGRYEKLCKPCKKKISSIHKKWRESEELRKLINRQKRKLNESTKNNVSAS